MSKDFQDIVNRTAVGSDIVRVFPNAPFVIYASGTITPVIASGTADTNGVIEVTTLPTGFYDLYIDGTLRKSFHHIKADYVQKFPQTWTCFIPGTISADKNEDENHEVFFTTVAGKIVEINVVVEYADATADATIHVLKGAAQGASALTFGANSIWSVRCNPAQERYRWSHSDKVAQPAIEAQRCITVAVDYVAATIKGITVSLVFKAD